MTEVSPPNRSMEKEEHRPHSHRYRRGFQNFLIIKQLTEVLLSYHDYVSLLYTKALGAVGGGALRHQEVQKTKCLEVTDLKKMLRHQFQNFASSVGNF